MNIYVCVCVRQLLAEFQSIMQQITRMNTAVNPKDEAELQAKIAALSDEFTLEKTQEVFVTLMQNLMVCMEETVEDVNSRDPPLSRPQKQQQFQIILIKKQEEVKKKVLDQYNLDEETLDVAIRKYQDDPSFQQTFMREQQMQQQKAQMLLSTM